jgi:hypothetical protein
MPCLELSICCPSFMRPRSAREWDSETLLPNFKRPRVGVYGQHRGPRCSGILCMEDSSFARLFLRAEFQPIHLARMTSGMRSCGTKHVSILNVGGTECCVRCIGVVASLKCLLGCWASFHIQ